MSEEQTKQLSSRGKSRRERVEFARSRDILDVANELNMDLVRSGRDYRWKDHDSLVITPSKNLWKWYSRNQGGDVISLVEVMKEVDFNQAIDYLNDGRFKEFTAVEQVREEFSYYLKPYEQPFDAARSYLKDKRGLSDETIDFFLGQGVLAQANAKVNGSIEPVVVFKSFDFSGEIVGATLQGIEENWDKWPERGYAKNIVRNSDGITGMHVDVGQPNRLIFAESAIDLMSYYELHKDNLQDVRLISMDGLKESVIGRHLSQLLLEVSGRPIGKTHEQLAESLQTAIAHDFFSDGKNADLITLAVDNDEGGQIFIQSLQEKGAAVTPDLPMLEPGKDKADWNDLLQREKIAQQSVLKEATEAKLDNSRLAQAERKLERLKGQFDTRANSVYAHTRQANGQPMNDKRNGAAFFRKQEQLEGAVFATLDDIKKQEEQVEKLRHQQDLKERGFNKQGSGLEMSVQNIPRIKEELEKAERGESFFTRETLKRYRQELVKLEAMRDRLETTQISPGAQQLIDEGLVNQWQKQPTLYFVKGLRKVALELTEEGEFQPSQKYLAKDTKAIEKVSELLDQQASVNNEQVQNKEVEPYRKEIKSKKTKTAEEHYFDWFERMAATVQEQLQLPSPPKLASELETVVEPFITTDLDRLFARRLSLVLDPQRVEESEILSVYQAIEQLDKQISERMQEKEPRSSDIEVILHSSDEPLLSRYSPGEVIPYTEFVSVLYPENAKLFNEHPRTGPTVSLSDTGGTWFGLRTADGQILVERFRYDVGLEGESISDRLNRILSPAHLEQIRQIDTNFDIPSYVEDKDKELGIEVKLYRDKEHIDTLDFNDLMNHPNIEEMANELGHTSLSSYSEEFTIEILDKRLNQSQLNALLDQIFELGKEKDELKQFLTELLDQQASVNNEQVQNIELEPDPISLEQATDPKFELEFSELGMPDQPITNFDELQDWIFQQFDARYAGVGYFKTYLRVHTVDEHGQEVVEPIRFDIGKGKNDFDPMIEHVRDYLIKNEYIHGVQLDEQIEHLSTVARKDLPINIQESERLQELLGQVEELGQNAYFWVTEEDLGQPKEVVTQLDNWFSSGKADSTYKSDLFELAAGDYTYMIEFKDGSISLQNMEEYAQYLSSRIEKTGADAVALELETVIGDFNQMKESITEAMDKELEVITANRNSLSEEPQKPKEKPLEIINQEGDFNSEQHKKNETKIRDLSEQAQEAAPLPEATQSQPLKDLSPSQSESHSLLHFTIKNPQKSIYKDKYHPIKPDELSKLNHHASNIQNAAKWYLDNLSDTTLHYFYQQGDKQYNINIDFEQYHFMHLTGLFPIKNGQTAIKTLHDFAAGRGNYDNIMIADKEAAFQKIKVLPDLRAIMETDSFYFDQVEDIPKLHSLSLEHAIKSDDKDILLAFSSNNENIYPASLMELTDELKIQTEMSQHQNVILGIYQERDGEITQLSVNENFIKDNGEEMFSILKNKKYRAPSAEENPKREESYPPTETVKITPEAFTQVLDTVYNVGSPNDLSNVPEEFHGAWKHYFELSEASKGDFKHVIEKAVQEGLVLTESSFYQEWSQDRIYNENYHVRIQQVDNWPDGVNQPFNSGDLRAYKEFVTSLYKGNQVLGDSLTKATKITFDIYAPGGQLIKDKVSYDMGVETEPVSRLLGLGYRRLEGQPELAQIDEVVLSQLENKKVNQEIATEANEPVVAYKEVTKENSPKQDPFTSPKQEMKAILDRQVEKIVAEDMANPVPQIDEAQQAQIGTEFDYKTASAYEISEMAFQKIREYTQSPEALAEYVEFMSKFPQLSPRNVALIQAQWPGANAVATYDQWQGMGEVLGIDSSDVIQTKKVYTNKRTGETKEVIHQGLSVKTGEKAQITLFRPLMTKMIPVLDAQGNQLKNDKGNPKYKKLSQATPQEKALVKEGKLQVKQFQERDLDTGVPRFTTYKVFELSQTTLKPESYPKAMPNRHFDFNTDQIKTTEVLEGLCDYAKTIGVTILQDDAHELGNIKGAFYPGRQLILLNSDNTPGEKIATTIHELAHATLHNPSLTDSYQAGLPKNQKELEAEMTSHLVSKHFGLDTSEKAFDYLAKWTKNLTALDDQQLTQSFKRIHKTVSQLVKHVEAHTKPYQVRKQRGTQPNFSQAPKKGPSR